ncbi:2-keto-4-pentenoate hydratase [Euzebya sp.]|uniref:2-keto-4-pentenoate hydratase n=1 Tax=Euzebya sp. TaxID=1971409 RepID=UPI003511D947
MRAVTLDIDAAAAELHRARLGRTPVRPLSERVGAWDLDAAYRVQAVGMALREADGERVVGGKLGFTSAAMRRAMGVASPNYGWLTDAMWLRDGVVALDRFIHPKVEPEIAFLLGRDLDGAVDVEAVLVATEAVAPCLEVVDSRYVGFRFGALDNIADDSSAGGVALGDPVPLDDIDLRLVGVVVSDGDEVVHTAAGAAAHGHPAAAVAWMAGAADQPLRAGMWVISGGLTGPVDLTPGAVVTAEFDRLGTVRVAAEEG